MIGYLCKSLRIISLVWPTRLVVLATGEVLSFGFNLAVLDPSDRKGNDTCCIEPKAKHFSHCKKDQSIRPNQTNNSKRLAKISNHAYKNSEKNQILFIDNLDHKPTIHRISTNTLQKVLHRIDLQEHRGKLCIENQRERRSHLANNYGPEGQW